MIGSFLPPRAQRDGPPRINRAPSKTLAFWLPWLLVIVGSLIPTVPVIASAALLPPLGYLLVIAWQQLRPGLFPVWAGLPLGLIDDLYSGQPFGSAVVLWSLTVVGLDLIEMRFPWRGFAYDWAVAAGLIAAYLLIGLWLANSGGGHVHPAALAPQIAISVLSYPLAARLAWRFDHLRLTQFRVL